MNKKQVYIISGVITLILIIGMALVLEIRDVPDYNWTSQYDLEEKDPSDAYAFAQLLEKRFGVEKIEVKSDSIELDSLSEKQLYISIGSSIRYNRVDEKKLLNFIESGNDAILISGNINFNIPYKKSSESYDSHSRNEGDSVYDTEEFKELDNLEESYEDEDYNEFLKDTIYENENDLLSDSSDKTRSIDTIIRHRFINIDKLVSFYTDTILEFDFIPFDSARSSYNYLHYGKEFKKAKSTDFKHFNKYTTVDREPLIFARDSLHIYCRLKIGEGHLYIHTAPELFTNLATQQSFYLDHFNKVFSEFNIDKVILDEPDPLSYLFDRKDQKSPLQYILSVPSLSWAYYLLVATLILFVIFRGKRTQRIIPTMQKNTNTSMDYIKTLSVLHQNQGQNSKLIKHIREGFFHRIKTKYYLDHKDEFFKEKLAAKSKIDLSEVENLLHKLHSTSGAEFSDDQLITLYKQIESFYKKAA